MMKNTLAALGLIVASFNPMNTCQADGIFRSSFGATIAYQDTGGSNKPPLVLIHGFPVNHEMWVAQVSALKDSYRVITYDLRGFGESKIQDAQYTLEVMVDDFFALLDHLKLEKASVAGFSMGGYIALRAIERDQSRFQSLILVDTQSAADSNEAKIKRTEALKSVKAKPNGLSDYGRNFVKAALSPMTLQENPKVVQHVIQMIDSNSEQGVSGGLLALISRTDITSFLPRIEVPTFILVGEKDSITPLKSAQAMKEQIPGAKLQVISGSGHFTPVENPKDLNTSLLDFLKGL